MEDKKIKIYYIALVLGLAFMIVFLYQFQKYFS
jgi:hypothetical protein